VRSRCEVVRFQDDNPTRHSSNSLLTFARLTAFAVLWTSILLTVSAQKIWQLRVARVSHLLLAAGVGGPSNGVLRSLLRPSVCKVVRVDPLLFFSSSVDPPGPMIEAPLRFSDIPCVRNIRLSFPPCVIRSGSPRCASQSSNPPSFFLRKSVASGGLFPQKTPLRFPLHDLTSYREMTLEDEEGPISFFSV